MNRYLSLILSILLLSFAQAAAQKIDMEHQTLTLSGGAGYMINALGIYENLLETKLYGTAAMEFGFQTRQSDDNYFAWAFNYPEMGIGFSWLGTGKLEFKNDSYLKDLYTLYGFFRTDFIKTKVFSIGPFVNLGATYSPSKYDYYSNPANTYIGSNVIVLFGAGLDGAFHISENIDLGIKTTLAHRSNGMLRVPNYGLNKCEMSAYLKYDFSPSENNRRGSRPHPEDLKRFNVDIYTSSGVHSCDVERHAGTNESLPPEEQWTECRQWLRLNIGADVAYRYHPVFSSGIGLDLFYTGNTRALEKCERILNGNEVKLDPIYAGIYLQQNFHYRNVMASIALGGYLYKNLGPEDSKWNYQRASIRYYLPCAGNVFLGFAMRAHSFDRSDTLEFTFGKRF